MLEEQLRNHVVKAGAVGSLQRHPDSLLVLISTYKIVNYSVDSISKKLTLRCLMSFVLDSLEHLSPALIAATSGQWCRQFKAGHRVHKLPKSSTSIPANSALAYLQLLTKA